MTSRSPSPSASLCSNRAFNRPSHRRLPAMQGAVRAVFVWKKENPPGLILIMSSTHRLHNSHVKLSPALTCILEYSRPACRPLAFSVPLPSLPPFTRFVRLRCPSLGSAGWAQSVKYIESNRTIPDPARAPSQPRPEYSNCFPDGSLIATHRGLFTVVLIVYKCSAVARS